MNRDGLTGLLELPGAVDGGSWLGVPPLFAAGLAAALIVLLVLVWRAEARRRLPVWRRALWAVLAAGLWLLAVEPRVPGKRPAGGGALLTDRASSQQRNEAVDRFGAGNTFVLAGAPAPRDPSDPGDGRDGQDEKPRSDSEGARTVAESVRRIADTGFLARERPDLVAVRVYGSGLDPWDLERLAGVTVEHEPVPAGERPVVRALTVPRRVTLGEAIALRIQLEPRRDLGAVTVAGPGGEEARIDLDAEASAPQEADSELGDVTVSIPTKRVGRYVYRVRVEDRNGRRLVEEPFGVVVQAASRRRVLWLQEAPGFEARHLKNWLGDAGFEMVVRSRVSLGRYRTELVNLAPATPVRLNRAGLASFDLVVVDPRSLAALGASGRQTLREAVRADGVGVWLHAVRGRSAAAGLDPLLGSAVRRAVADETLTARLAWPGVEPLPPLEVPPLELVLGSDADEASGLGFSLGPLARDQAGRVVAAVRPWGRGRLAVTVLEDLYRWTLAGERAAYRAFWNRVLNEVARNPELLAWSMPAAPVLVGRPTQVELTLRGALAARVAGAGTLPRVTVATGEEAYPVPVVQDLADPLLWRLTFWPRQAGWHRLRVTADATDASDATDAEAGSEAGEAWLWVAPSDRHRGWLDQSRAVGLRARSLGAGAVLGGMAGPGGEAGPRDEDEAVQPSRFWRPVPRWPLFLAVLVAWALLWLAERRSTRKFL